MKLFGFEIYWKTKWIKLNRKIQVGDYVVADGFYPAKCIALKKGRIRIQWLQFNTEGGFEKAVWMSTTNRKWHPMYRRKIPAIRKI